jgi:hypothetical protein
MQNQIQQSKIYPLNFVRVGFEFKLGAFVGAYDGRSSSYILAPFLA